MKLISTTDYVLAYKYLSNKPIGMQRDDKLISIERYVNFLKTPLELSMFVPVDEDGNVLREPKKYSDFLKYGSFGLLTGSEVDENSKYHKAKERVIFEGFEICTRNSSLLCVMNEDTHIHNFDKTIEDLVPHNLTLTQNTIKKYGI